MAKDTEKPQGSGLYDEYLTTTYVQRNDLSPVGLERIARSYSRDLGPYMPEDRSAAILELGCGVGGFLDFCRQAGYSNVRGVDISREQVQFCRKRGFEHVQQGDAVSYLEQTRESFDLVVMSDVLEHVPKPQVVPLLGAVLSHLESRGMLILRVPNMSNPLNLRTRFVDFTHECGFTQESLGQVLRMAGFDVHTIRGVFHLHHRWLARLVFDRLLWRLLRLLYRHTLHLKNEPVRGKNLIGVGIRPGD